MPGGRFHERMHGRHFARAGHQAGRLLSRATARSHSVAVSGTAIGLDGRKLPIFDEGG
ncbi:MAG: hypothetical protein K0Q52_3568 [Microbacterium sp.]|nr:hypothetical protein [Microbacterium sp.]